MAHTRMRAPRDMGPFKVRTPYKKSKMKTACPCVEPKKYDTRDEDVTGVV